MPLSAGTRLGPYEIGEPIGAGAMGVVYRARDTRLGRDVAVKVLPGGKSLDTERLRRFEQEARLAGSLSHPNVITVFDVGSHEGGPYLVTELLEGRSLRDLLAAAPLPTRRATEYAQQAARGLAAAHERGVVHRDLKPANIFVTKDGRVKILDFGVAKLTHAEPTVAGPSKQSTATAVGLAVGTAGYMSPEQVRGHAVDARSDIFALGTVVFEMLTGRRAFSGDTPVDMMTAILTQDPEGLSRPGLVVPAGLERIVRRCLEKDPAERFQSARDVAFALEAESATSGAGMEPAAVAIPPPRRWLVATGIGLAVVVAAALGLWSGRRIWERPSPRITQLTFRRGVVDRARFTPDGKTVVYSAFWDGNPPEIFTTRVENTESRSLGLPPARLMSVSSRGEMAVLLTAPGDLGDQSTGTLARVPLSGGEPRRLLEDVLAADWSPDGRELAVIRRVEGEFQLEYPIGTLLARPARGPHVRVSPAGDRVAVTHDGAAFVYDRRGHQTLLKTPPWCWGLAWAHDEAIWVTAGPPALGQSLWMVTLDGRGREVYRVPGSLLLQDASKDGRVLVHHGFERLGVRAKAPGETNERELGVFNLSWVVDLSSDGMHVLLTEGGSTAATTHLRPTHGGPAVRLGEGRGVALSPAGRWALVASSQYLLPLSLTPTGPGEAITLRLDRFESAQAAWFLDEDHIVIDAAERVRRPRAFLLDLPKGEPRPVTPEGTVSIRASHHDGYIIGVALDGTLERYPLEGGEPQPTAARLPPGTAPVCASGDGRALFVSRPGVPFRVDRLELATGRLTPWRVLRPDDLTGVVLLGTAAITSEGRAYAYAYGRFYQDLYLVEGLRY